MTLETKRLILRSWTEEDAEECWRYARDPRVGPAAGWPPHVTVEDSRRVIREVLAVPETYAIVLKETGLPVGSIGLHHNDLAEKEDEAELGYWIGVPYWGRGLVPEAAREMLRHAFEDLGLARVWCGYYDGNDKSKRVQEKLGFIPQWTNDEVPVPQMNEIRKGHVSLMTRADWESSRVAYRRLTEDDLEAFIGIRIAQLREEGATEDIDLAPSLRNYYHRHMADGTFVSWLAVSRGRIVGTSGMSFVEKPPYFSCPTGRIGLLSSMYTDPGYRRRGIARELLRRVVEDAAEYGCGSVQITASDMGVYLYRDFGFVRNENFMQYRLSPSGKDADPAPEKP